MPHQIHDRAATSTGNLRAPEVVADPYGYFGRLREEDPVVFHPGEQAWLLTRYDDVSAGFRHPHLSSDRLTPFLAALKPALREEAAGVLVPLSRWMLFADAPAHTRLRAMVSPAFTAAAIGRLTERIGTIVDELLAAFVQGGHTDLLRHVAYPLPAIVIAELLGVPDDRREDFKSWSDDLALIMFSAGDEDRYRRAAAGLSGLNNLFAGLIERYAAAPGENLVSELVTGPGSLPDGLTPDELTAMCTMLLFAGHETTTNFIALATHHLLRTPAARAHLQAGPDIATQTAVEELLRFDGPIPVTNRHAAADFELRGQRIRTGDRVILVHAAANRDPRKFVEPDRLDLARTPNPHMSLGNGIHTCIGGPLARLEARIALPKILALPGLRSVEQELRLEPVISSRTLKGLDVAYG